MRIPFLVLAIAGLIAGLAGGLSRIGWDLNVLQASMHHGAIMVGGFLGTLIALEKIIPLKKKALFVIPALSGASVVLFFAHLPEAAFGALVLSALLLSAVFLHYRLKTKDMIYSVMLCGSLCWLAGNFMLASKAFYPAAFPWWMGYILFIITAERLELTKFLPVKPQQKNILIVFLLTYIVGALWSFHAGGNWISGPALIAVSLWLMRFDVVSISLKRTGLQKYIAIALLCGYIAMLLAGIFLITLPDKAFGYDALLHTFFLGFVFSMIFAHGPVILPGVIGISAKPWHPVMYLWLALLQVSWITRVVADLLWQMELRKISGLASAVAIVCYFVTMATLTFRNAARA